MAVKIFHQEELPARVSREGSRLGSVPAPVGETVVRPRLVQILDSAVDVIVVNALPGFGKTTFVADWAQGIRRDGKPVVWINMADTPESVAECLVAEFGCSGGGVLVLDDFRERTDRAFLDKLCTLIRSTPRLRMVVLAVADWTELRAEARHHGLSVKEVQGVALLADQIELAAMGAAWGHVMSESRTENLLSMTGGWPQLAKLVLDAHCEQDLDHDEAKRFLSHHVGPGIGHNDQGSLGMASRLSLAPVITALHVEESLNDMQGGMLQAGQNSLGPRIILRLEETGLLRRIRGDGAETMWRFPMLVREVLAEDFRTYHSAFAVGWHARMAKVMFARSCSVEQGMILHHARKGDAWSVLAGMWNRHTLMLAVSNPMESTAAYMDLPRAALESEPVLAMAGSAVTAAAKFDAGPNRYAAGQRALMHGFRTVKPPVGKAVQMGIPLPEQARMTVAGMIAHRSRGRFTEAIELADAFANRADGVVIAGGPSEYSGKTAWFRQQRALTVLLSGDVAGSRPLFSESYDCAVGPNEDFIAVDAAYNMALTCALSGWPDSARDWLETAALDPIDNEWVKYMVGLPGCISRSLLALDVLEIEGAAIELAKAGDGSNHMELWPFIVLASTELALLRGELAIMAVQLEKVVLLNAATYSPGSAAEQVVARCRAELFLARGELNRAARVLDDAGEFPGQLEVPRARLQLLAGNHDRAFRLAASGVWDKSVSQRDKLDLLLIKAAAAEYRGDGDAAGKAFAQAVALAGTSGQLRPFRALSPALLLVLADRSGVTLPAAALERVQAGLPMYPVSATLVELSLRERTVLYEMDRQATVADIAKELVVSPNTVKKQLGSIYAKLGVQDRQAALDQALQLAFLPEPAKA